MSAPGRTDDPAPEGPVPSGEDAASDAGSTLREPAPLPPADVPAPPDLTRVSATIEAPSADVAEVPPLSRIPGRPREGYGQLPTAPVLTTPPAPVDAGEDVAEWTPAPEPAPHPVLAGWALGLAVLGLVASFFVGWMLPLGVVAVAVGVLALRRPVESRTVAVWGIVLGAASVAYSVGWLLWALPRL